MAFIFIAICVGLYFLIRTMFFKQYSEEYKKSCKPVILWAVIFVGICGTISCQGFEVFQGFFSPYDKWMDTGSNFGRLGINIAGDLARRDMESRIANTPGLSDYMDMGFASFLVSGFLGIITLLCGYLTINGIRKQRRASINVLSTFHLISAVLSAVSIAFFVNMMVAGKVVTDGVEGTYDGSEPNFMLTGVLSFILAAGFFVFYYMYKYRPALEHLLAMEPVISNTNSSVGGSIISAVAKAVNNNPDAGKPTKSCPYCGETILAVATKCKHCGEWLPKEEEKKMIACPVCGEMVEEGVEVCPYCHERMDGSTIRKPEPEQKLITCPVCAEQISDNVDVCPYCHEKINTLTHSHHETEKKMVVCSACGEYIPDNVGVCPICGEKIR